ncbi:MAG: DUF5060 domain-containing protein [Verrucomicrobia bacterium]|nr:DUF5060 domain-containing protein [Verrucomicrobiota bacterium]
MSLSHHLLARWLPGLIGLAMVLGVDGKGRAAELTLLGEPTQWSLVEFRIAGVPAAANPFDPEAIRVDAVLRAPSGGQQAVPGFYYREFSRSLVGGDEQLSAAKPPEWRLRFRPVEEGPHAVTATIFTNGQPAGPTVSLDFAVAANPKLPARRGVVRIAANQRHFETGDGQALPLIGHCVCWHHRRGTFDFDDWFGAMAAAGENYARLWMSPWALGIEAEPDTGVNYRLDRAWQLDHVFGLAEQHGTYLMLCFDYHGMFETTPDYWGGNDNWKLNPYNAANGGPCANQNEFFTKPEARAMYQKRLRYLIARYGHSPNLLAWQFFNELDNVYSHLQPADVAAWHAVMGDWLKSNDPWRHLVTTSLTGGSDRPEIWQLPQMEFAMEDIHAEQLYPAYTALREVLVPAGWGDGEWQALGFQTAGDPPVQVGDPLPEGHPFNVTLPLGGNWGAKPNGELAVANTDAEGQSASVLNAFVHGSAHPDLRTPFRLDAWFTNAARLVMRLNSVSDGAVLGVFVDRQPFFQRSLPNKDGQWLVNHEYNEDIVVELPAGRHLVEIRNTGGDWFYLDWVRLEAVRPARYADDWRPSPVAVGLRGSRESLLYVVNPRASYPANATNAVIEPFDGDVLRVRSLPAGSYRAWWYHPQTGAWLGETAGTSDGALLTLPLLELREDLAGRLERVVAPAWQNPHLTPEGAFMATLLGEADRSYQVEISPNLQNWSAWTNLANATGQVDFHDDMAGADRRFYRARLTDP